VADGVRSGIRGEVIQVPELEVHSRLACRRRRSGNVQLSGQDAAPERTAPRFDAVGQDLRVDLREATVAFLHRRSGTGAVRSGLRDVRRWYPKARANPARASPKRSRGRGS
jgi:hypothetical protein